MHGLDVRDLRVRSQGQRPKRRRRTPEDLRRQVEELPARGIVGVAIADALNVADRRVQRLLRELEAGAA